MRPHSIENRYAFWCVDVMMPTSASMLLNASGPFGSGVSPFLIFPGVFAQWYQSVCVSLASTWNAAVDEPHMKFAGNVTLAGGGGVSGVDEQATQTAATMTKRRIGPRHGNRPLHGTARRKSRDR